MNMLLFSYKYSDKVKTVYIHFYLQEVENHRILRLEKLMHMCNPMFSFYRKEN